MGGGTHGIVSTKILKWDTRKSPYKRIEAQRKLFIILIVWGLGGGETTSTNSHLPILSSALADCPIPNAHTTCSTHTSTV